MKRTNPLATVGALICGFLLLAACDAGTDPIGPPASIQQLDGDSQAGTVGETLPQPLKVRVEDSDGNPTAGVEVAWTVTAGGAIPATTATDAEGVATAAWTLGSTAGAQTATAAIEGAGSAGFAATAEAGPIAAMVPSVDSIAFGALGSSQIVSVIGEDQYGNEIAGPQVEWTSEDPTTATVDEGEITSTGTGETLVVATVENVSVSIHVVVEQEPSSVALSLARDTVTAIGDTLAVTAAVTDGNGHEVEEAAAELSVSDTSVFVISPEGEVVAVGAGSAVILAVFEGISDTATAVVHQRPAVVEVAPAADTLEAIADTLVLTLEAKDANGHTIADVMVEWSSQDEAVARVSADGVVTANANGVTEISATVDGVSGMATVDVAQVATSIQIGETVDTLHAIRDAFPLTATAADANGYAVDATDAVWSSLDTTVVSVAEGTATARGNGQARVRVEAGVAADTAEIVVRQVLAFLALAQSADSMAVGGSAPFPVVFGSDSNRVRMPDELFTATWSSADPAVVSVEPTRMVANAMGSTALTVSSNDVSATSTILVGWSFVTMDGWLNHTCGLAPSGDAYCWGNGNVGQLGTGSSGSGYVEMTPALVADGHTWSSVSVGAEHTCGVTTSGEAYCWGRGQLGIGFSATRTTPTLVGGGHTWSSVSVARRHTCGVTVKGDAYCWGDGEHGLLGTGISGADYVESSPALVAGGHQWSNLSAGTAHTCGVTTSGEAFCWGIGGSGQLGVGGFADEDAPVLVGGGYEWATIDVGASHTCGTTTSEDAYCWGAGHYGMLGNGSIVGRASPTLVAGDSRWASLTAGYAHTCGTTTSGAGFCWGAVTSGSTITIPGSIYGSREWSGLTAGTFYTCGVTSSNESFCWGRNDVGELGIGSLDAPIRPFFLHIR